MSSRTQAFREPLIVETLAVDDTNDTKLAYTDTGAPSRAGPYTTVFAVHGMAFNSGTCTGIFEPVQALAKSVNIRFVAVTRRNYKGSSPFTEEELRVMNGGGSEDEKSAFIVNRGVELLNFIDRFLIEKDISTEAPRKGEPGGIAIIGWSLGNTVTLSAIANVKFAAPVVRDRLGPLIHTLIMHECARAVLGHPIDQRTWAPWHLVDQTIPEDAEMPFFACWISSYFEHRDLEDRTGDGLENHVPGFNCPPTIYNIAAAGRLDIIEGTPAKGDIPYQIFFFPQYQASYNALFEKEARKLVPNMKASFICCEHGPAFGPSARWMVEDHDREHGGGFIEAKLVKGINHFSTWDDPEVTLKMYQDCIDRSI
ncbi:hypothetical protein NP233_g3092 [Leucocoprinus birnbaumii]|uniref:AB hydrolase-1 domain-containing protein n=1 Tax=Leucocoprinus birnbaumii TaxID=56174 RepID=A0AAD5YYK3_9AGAR|nr:hypothetical protein NP233_g3092 [Leucocoprinus birnbaumii]